MAKLHAVIDKTEFTDAVRRITDDTLSRSKTTSLEESFDEAFGDTKIAIRTIERFSIMGGNRVSMTIVFAQSGDEPIHIMATSSGGGGAIVKVVGWGEASFLETLQASLTESFQDCLVGDVTVVTGSLYDRIVRNEDQ